MAGMAKYKKIYSTTITTKQKPQRKAFAILCEIAQALDCTVSDTLIRLCEEEGAEKLKRLKQH